MELIQTITLDSSSSSITFDPIPQDYDDLVVLTSARSDGIPEGMYISFNSLTTNFSGVYLYSDASTPSSGSLARYVGTISGTYTANTFNNTSIYISDYTTSNAKSFSVDNVTENNATRADANIIAGLWDNTAAITSLSITQGNNFVAGSTFSLYGVKNIAKTPKATGGIISYNADDGYFYHTFTASSTFTPTENINAEYLVVAGGGGSGNTSYSGGGGAGGYLTGSGPLTAQNYTITVGAGGAESSDNNTKGSDGTTSSAFSITPNGGGGGGAYFSMSGSAGGSGGGGSTGQSGPGPGGLGTSGQGNDGGAASGTSETTFAGGGGGGAGEAGANGVSQQGGKGGDGLQWLNGNYYAGGGGAGVRQSGLSGLGGLGGGGNGASHGDNVNFPTFGTGTAGEANTGGGGGTLNPGGSGVVIIRYAA